MRARTVPEPGIPESFKVLLKELQSLALDVRVLDEDGNEVKLLESQDYGNTNLRSIIEGDRYSGKENEEKSLGKYGFSRQEFRGEQLQPVEEEETEEEENEEDFLDDISDDEVFDDQD